MNCINEISFSLLLCIIIHITFHTYIIVESALHSYPSSAPASSSPPPTVLLCLPTPSSPTCNLESLLSSSTCIEYYTLNGTCAYSGNEFFQPGYILTLKNNEIVFYGAYTDEACLYPASSTLTPYPIGNGSILTATAPSGNYNYCVYINGVFGAQDYFTFYNDNQCTSIYESQYADIEINTINECNSLMEQNDSYTINIINSSYIDFIYYTNTTTCSIRDGGALAFYSKQHEEIVLDNCQPIYSPNVKQQLYIQIINQFTNLPPPTPPTTDKQLL